MAEFLTLVDLAHLLGCCTRTVRRAVAAGQLPRPVMVGKRSFWRRADIERLFDEAAETSPQPAEAD